ncbi:MAG: GntR family transcriptional regulator [Hyphomicrobiales bacterium]|nr:GntR family transcriptional regulator [Hyphomicrobiales bacterium]
MTLFEPADNIFEQQKWAKKRSGPLYAQLRDHLVATIKNGGIKPGEPLPSERKIAEIGNVSRITVRKAVQELVRDGLVVQKQGSGTSVAPELGKVQQSLSILTSFSEDMARRGKEVRSIWLEKGLFSPSPRETMALGLMADSQVSRISRLRIADDIPLAIERAALSPQYLPDPENVGKSLYDHLDRCGFKPSRAIQRISANNLGKSDAELLQTSEGAASLNIERLSYLSTGQIVEFTQSIYRGDTYDFVAELQIATGET